METTTFQKQYPLAMIALGEHMQAHHLPAPTAVDIVEYGHFGQQPTTHTIRLRLPFAGDVAWVNSVIIDHEDTVEVDLGFRTTWSVRLPNTGFRFQLVALRAHPLHVVAPAAGLGASA